MRYFDHNATSPLLPAARDAWLEANERCFGNASSPHRVGARADRALDEARERLALPLDCHPGDIVWTSGASEANNQVLRHVAAKANPDREVWVSAVEHPSILTTASALFRGRLRQMPVTPAGLLDLDWLRDGLRRGSPALVAIMAANNETGVLQPWREALEVCRSAGVPLLCDAVQWAGKLPIAGLGACDFVTGSAHKFGGPKGVGFLKCPSRGRVEAMILGGAQEDGRRAGTENVPGILAMMAALGARERALTAGEQAERCAWRDEFVGRLEQLLPGSALVGAGAERLWNTVSALMPDADCQQRWVVKLDRLGFAVSTGSACSSGQEKPSHVLTAMGRNAAEAGRVLRFSSGWETTREDWQALLAALVSVYGELSSTTSKRSALAT